MKYLPDFSLSLHSKLVIVTWLMVVYLVLLLCGIASFITVIYVKSGLEEQGIAIIRDSQTVLNLKALVLKTVNVTNSCLMSEGIEARNDFDNLNKEINTAYAAIYSVPGSIEKQHALDNAYEEWQEVRVICSAILSLPKSPQNTISPEFVQRYTTLNDRTIGLENTLDRLYEMLITDSTDIGARIKALDERALPIILLLFITSLGINSVAIILIIRSVVIPTHLLAQAAHNYAQGSLSYRIPLDSRNEIGELARTFNYMAEKLESSYTALKDMAIHDGLTGILNHHEFQKRLLWEIKRAGRYKRNVSLIMLDIDRFKTFNDTYGHQAGDSVLRAIGQYLGNAIRSSDDAARYGGEEFALIMPETPAETAFITAQRIGEEIARLPITTDENTIMSVTVSIGVATFPQDAATREGLIAAADRTLYRAKQLGRNRVCKSSD